VTCPYLITSPAPPHTSSLKAACPRGDRRRYQEVVARDIGAQPRSCHIGPATPHRNHTDLRSPSDPHRPRFRRTRQPAYRSCGTAALSRQPNSPTTRSASSGAEPIFRSSSSPESGTKRHRRYRQVGSPCEDPSLSRVRSSEGRLHCGRAGSRERCYLGRRCSGVPPSRRWCRLRR
jgi:hypothetical protein